MHLEITQMRRLKSELRANIDKRIDRMRDSEEVRIPYDAMTVKVHKHLKT